jgi:hypothetical protein
LPAFPQNIGRDNQKIADTNKNVSEEPKVWDSLIKAGIKSYKKGIVPNVPQLKSHEADSIIPLLKNPGLYFNSQISKAINGQRQKLAGLTGINKLIPLNLVKNPIALNGATASYSAINNSAYIASSGQSYYGNWNINSSWAIASIPFTIQFNNQNWNDLTTNNFSNLAAQFDKESYLNQLKKSLKGKFNVDQFLNSDLRSQIEGIKTNAESVLKKDLESINKTFDGALNDKIHQLGDLKGMLTKDMATVREQMLNSEYIKSISEKENVLIVLQNKKNTGQPVNESELKELEKEVTNIKGVNALLQKIEEHKNKWQSSGLLTKIKQMELLDGKQVEKTLKDPGTIATLAKQHLHLNGLQKLFLKIKELNIGQNTLSTSPLSVQHLINKGINTNFLNNNKSFLLGIGKLKTLNSVFDQPFTGSILSNDGLAKMISFGIGKASSSQSHISLMTYNQSLGSINSIPGISGLPGYGSFRNTVVTTISNEIPVGERGSITAEFSRSASSYGQSITSDSTLQDRKAIQKILGTDNFFNNMAFGVKYEDDLYNKGINYGLHINMTSKGYTNPGNTFLNSGGKEYGFNVRKYFWNRKLQASIRSDLREFNYSEEAGNKYRNIYSVMDVRWQLRKGQSLGIRYMPNKMVRIENGQKTTTTSLNRLSADATIAQKIGSNYYRNNITLSRQKNGYALGTGFVNNTTLTFSSFQNITVNRKLLYLNLQYDYANNNSQYVYFNSSLLTEAGMTYLVLKKVSLSSAISYNSVKGWYNQVGIKQTISSELNDRFNLNLFVDARKNIALYQPLLYGLFRADISIHYLLKK